MSSSLFNKGNQSPLERLFAASTCRGLRRAEQSAQKGSWETSVLTQLEKAVDDTHDSARFLDRARDVASQVRFANLASAEVRVSDVDRAAQMAQDLADRISDTRREGGEVIQLSAAKVNRLLAES